MPNDKDVKLVQEGPKVEVAKTIQEQLLELQLRRELREASEEDAKQEAKRASQLAGIRAMAERRENELAKQRQCGHKKPYGESALVGQRLHSHRYCYLCQYCSKEWYDNDVPLDLRINSELVGGPSA